MKTFMNAFRWMKDNFEVVLEALKGSDDYVQEPSVTRAKVEHESKLDEFPPIEDYEKHIEAASAPEIHIPEDWKDMPISYRLLKGLQDSLAGDEVDSTVVQDYDGPVPIGIHSDDDPTHSQESVAEPIGTNPDRGKRDSDAGEEEPSTTSERGQEKRPKREYFQQGRAASLHYGVDEGQGKDDCSHVTGTDSADPHEHDPRLPRVCRVGCPNRRRSC